MALNELLPGPALDFSCVGIEVEVRSMWLCRKSLLPALQLHTGKLDSVHIIDWPIDTEHPRRIGLHSCHFCCGRGGPN